MAVILTEKGRRALANPRVARPYLAIMEQLAHYGAANAKEIAEINRMDVADTRQRITVLARNGYVQQQGGGQ